MSDQVSSQDTSSGLPIKTLREVYDLVDWAESLRTHLDELGVDYLLDNQPDPALKRDDEDDDDNKVVDQSASVAASARKHRKKKRRQDVRIVTELIRASVQPAAAVLQDNGYALDAPMQPRGRFDAVIYAMQQHAWRSGLVRDLVLRLCVVDADSCDTLAAYQGELVELRRRMHCAGCYPGDAHFMWAAVLGLRLAYPALFAELDERLRARELDLPRLMQRIARKAIKETVVVSPSKGTPVRERP
ncbi:uncharacterized protein E0L32_003016 [Thyridium curvatum]|uniref:Uncharacterized protein n=1 Tax=Thyridium curvatum TaxID=1093900 RepID=A0A507B467_9PEZI|nr:uncharacterized protein E0L32_003016 [Thyridium curvatum]TPX17915.1 hypothetical protein E0L32_003016 [Thyridium curvatum]